MMQQAFGLTYSSWSFFILNLIRSRTATNARAAAPPFIIGS